METNGAISFKVYLLQEKLKEIETRRFAVSQTTACSFSQICEKLVEIFPKLNEKLFYLFWKDEDEDEVYVSSDEELIVALTSMKSEVKKFYIKIRDSLNCEDSKNSRVLHPMVYCDGCNKKIKGFRYKCILCKNYDLCSSCEQMSIHPEHPMLRIPTPDMIDGITLFKLGQILSSFLATKSENLKHHAHHSKKHGENYSHYDCHKRKRKYEKFESGHEPDDSEEGCHRKHCHDKWRKMNRCTYGAILNEFWKFLNPVDFQSQQNDNAETAKQSCKGNTEEMPSAPHLKNIEKTISSLLNSLGINVDIEVQSASSEGEEKKSKNLDVKDKLPSGSSSSSSSEPKEVTISEDVNSQKESNSKKTNESPEKDDWVSFEDLKNEIETMSSSNTEDILKTVKPKSSVTFSIDEEEKKTVLPSEDNIQQKESQTLYPKLNSVDFPKDPKIKQALEKMLAMGFTNDGGWLTQLLEYKKGDINQVLEVLTPHNNR